VALHVPTLSNFSPLMALAFCGGVYFTNRWQRLAPFVALSVTDLYIDHYYATEYGYQWTLGGVLLRTLCFAAALGFGLLVARRRSWLNLFSGALGGAVLFYLVTNTASWLGDAGYAHNAAGWWQAMTVGHPEFPPTLVFFRNTSQATCCSPACLLSRWKLQPAAAARSVCWAQRANRPETESVGAQRADPCPTQSKSAASSASLERSPFVSFTCAAMA